MKIIATTIRMHGCAQVEGCGKCDSNRVRMTAASIRQQKRARASIAVQECHEATHQANK